MEKLTAKVTMVKTIIIYSNNNSIQFFIIYVPSQQLQDQLQTEHSVDTGNYIMDKHNMKSKTNYRQAVKEITINTEK
jgi:hypothetical protein